MELFRLLGRIVIDNSEANQQIEESAYNAQKSQGKITKAFAKIGTAVAGAFAVDKIKDFGMACIEAAADAGAMNSQFSQVFGELEEDATSNLSAIAESAGMLENRMKGSYTQIAAFAKTTGMDTASALELSNRAMIAVADSAAFYDRTLEETTESLQSFLKGNYENDAALGLSCTEVTRNAAANELYGKSFQELSEAQKQLTLLKMVEDANELSGALGQSARESETWTNQIGNLKQAWTDFTAVIGAKFLPFAVQVVTVMKDATVWMSEHEEQIFNIASALAVATSAMLAFKAGAVITSVISGFQSAQLALALYTASANGATISQGLLNGTLKLSEGIVALLTGKITLGTAATTMMTKAQMALNAAWKANPVGIVITALTALAGVFVVLWNRSETFRNFWITLWNDAKATASNAFNTIKDAANKAINFFTNTLPNGLASLPSKMGEIGLNLVKGLWNGISNAKDWVLGKIKGFGQGILNGLKSFFGIHSPSKVMEEQVGKQLALGVAQGIANNTDEVDEAAEEMGSRILKAANQTLKEYKRVHKMSIAEEVAYWAEIVKQTKKGTEARIEAEDKYYEALEAQQQEIEELEEERARQREEQLEEYKEQLEEFQEAHKDFVEQIMDQTDLFDPFKISDSGVTGAELIENLQSQVDGLISYGEIMDDLESKLRGTALLEKLKEFGTDSLAELQAINSMTEAQLDEYVKLYDQKYSLAEAQAEESLGTSSKVSSITAKINSLISSASSTKSANGVTYDPNVDYQAEINRLTAQGAPADVIYSYQKKREAKIIGEGLDENGVKLSAHAEGGILTKPTIFGYTPSSGTYHLGGEAGKEAVAPIDVLQNYVRNAVASEMSGGIQKMIELLQMLVDKNVNVYLNSKKISEEVNKDLGVIY